MGFQTIVFFNAFAFLAFFLLLFCKRDGFFKIRFRLCPFFRKRMENGSECADCFINVSSL